MNDGMNHLHMTRRAFVGAAAGACLGAGGLRAAAAAGGTTAARPRVRPLPSDGKTPIPLLGLPGAIQGKICEDKRRLANGATAVYHNLQYWADGRNHTVRIPRDKLPAFREAVKGGATAKRLLAELTKADAESILSSESPLKKNSRSSS